MARAARERGDAEAARVAVAVEDALEAEVPDRVGEELAVVALVEIEAGLVAGRDVEGERPVVLANGHARARRVVAAAQPARRRHEPFALARRRVAALEEAPGMGLDHQRVGDDALPALDAGREELGREHVAVAIDDEAGQSVGLAVHEAHAVASDRQAPSHRHGSRDPAREERGIDTLLLVEAPCANADRRERAVRAPGQELAVARLDANRLARVGLAAGDAALEHPRMAALQRALLARPQANRFHLRRARGCAASYTFER